jgi:hypothetical protein
VINNKLNAIFIGIIEGLEHEEVSYDEIWFVGLLLKIFMQVVHE